MKEKIIDSIIQNKILILIFFIAFCMRLISLNQSLWLDEATTANVVKNFTITEILNDYSPKDFHPPLYYLFLKGWTQIFGYTEISIRSPSVIFSLLTGIFVYLIIKKLKYKQIEKKALTATAFFLFNPLIVYYSQEARMYMMVTFLCTVSFYLLLNVLEKKSLINLTLLNLTIVLSFITFYGSVFFLMTIYIYLLFKFLQTKKDIYSQSFLYLLIAPMILIFTAGPMLFSQIEMSKSALLQVQNWSSILGKVTVKNLLLIPIKFSIGRIDFYPKFLYYSLAGLWTGVIFFITGLGILKTSKKTPILAIFFTLPILLGVIFSFWSPLLQYFRFIYLIPFLSILLTLGISSDRFNFIKKYRTIILTTVLTGMVCFSFLYLINTQLHREDWQSLTKKIKLENLPVYMIASSSDPVKYYQPSIKIHALKNIQDNLNDNKKVVIIPYTSQIHGLDYKSKLKNKGYEKINTKSFRLLQYEIWRLK
jgi:uncharacterized membrane protein